MLPPDDHVHTEWSWDADDGSMERTCARAVQLGLPGIAFTEHVDLVRWVIAPERQHVLTRHAALVGPDGRFRPPPLDVDGYLACVEGCRERYPALNIVTGIELGEPHWFADEATALLGSGGFDRVLGSLHSVEVGGLPWLVTELYEPFAPEGWTPPGVVRAYLAGALELVESSAAFAVLAHVDYPLRAWPAGAGRYDPADFEEEYRAVLRSLAQSGRALEVNTVLPLRAEIVGWWHEAGGEAVTFGSDAHAPADVAHDFAAAADMVEAQGFRPGRSPQDFWRRRP